MTNNDYMEVYQVGGVQEVDERNLPQESRSDHGSAVIQTDSTPSFAELYNGIAKDAFSRKVTDILTANIDPLTVEIKPDGLIYLPEIKYRQILNEAFGVGAYSFLIRDKKSETISGKQIRVHINLIMYIEGRYHSEAWGAADYWQNNSNSDYSTAFESAKSVAIRRCCKDLGIASELWDPQFIRKWKKEFSIKVFCDNQKTGETRVLWRRKDVDPFDYPWRERSNGLNQHKPKNQQNPRQEPQQNTTIQSQKSSKNLPVVKGRKISFESDGEKVSGYWNGKTYPSNKNDYRIYIGQKQYHIDKNLLTEISKDPESLPKEENKKQQPMPDKDSPEYFRNKIRNFLKPMVLSEFIDQSYYDSIDQLISKINDIDELKKQILNVNNQMVSRARSHTTALLTNYHDQGSIRDPLYKKYCVELEEANTLDIIRGILGDMTAEVNRIKERG